ncbi:hypothetical protein [Sneathiella sp.]|uniref:5-methylcytosine restriction system specificity protein McrC n=1 Tax=Sneathiella sp. TaxID=1964365 RepID=UPI00356951D0
MAIPIQNVFYLFCYAWDQFHEGQKADVGGLESPRLQDLIAKVLIGSLNRILRRGLDRSYIEHGEDTARLRGRFDFGETVNRNLVHRRLVHCRVDELSPDVLLNQILKATSKRLAATERLDRNLAHDLRRQCQELREVADIRLTRGSFSKVQVHSHNAEYRFLMRLCELAYEALLPDETGRGYRFSDILEDEVRMSQVFENFVRNFFRRECQSFHIGSRNIEWDTGPLDEAALSVLPAMENDIRLDRPGQTVVIDTKYYKDMFQRNRGAKKLISANLYQIFTYVKNLAAQMDADTDVQGMLVYPTTTEDFEAEFAVQGHLIRVCTINLDQPWPMIHKALLSLIEIKPLQGGEL